MIDVSEITEGASFLYYDEEFNHKIAPEQVDILEYNDGFVNHSMYEYATPTEFNFCPIISPSRELGMKLFEVDELVDLTAVYYKALVASGNLHTVKPHIYQLFLDKYPEKMI